MTNRLLCHPYDILCERETRKNVFELLKMGHPRPLIRLFLFYQINVIIFTNLCEKMSIQYMVLGFEPTTFRT